MLNASIFGNMLNAPKSPEEYASERENLIAARQTNMLNQSKIDEYQRGIARQGELRNLLAGGADAVALRKGGFLDEAANLEKNAADVGLKKSQGMKYDADAQSAQYKLMRDKLDHSVSALVAAPDPESARQRINDGVGKGMWSMQEAQGMLQQVPNDPTGYQSWRLGKLQEVMNAKDQFESHLKQQKFNLDANNELIGQDGNPNNTLIGVKTGLAKAGAASTNVNVSTGQKGFDNELKLRSDFKQEPVYKAHQEMQSAYSQIQQSLKQATPAGDLAGATKIMKLLDPGSVVRESELGMAMAATGLLDRVQNYASNIINGTKLTPKQRVEFQQLADALYGESVKAYNGKRGEYQKLGGEYGLNADRAIGAPASLSAKPSGAQSSGVVDFGSLK